MKEKRKSATTRVRFLLQYMKKLGSSRACSRPVLFARIPWRSLLKAATRETATSRSDCIASHSSFERYTRDYTINAPIIIPIARGHCDIKRIDVIFCHEEDKENLSPIDRCLLLLRKY